MTTIQNNSFRPEEEWTNGAIVLPGTEETTGVKAPMTPRYISEVTRPAAALGKAVELQAARKRVLAGGRLPSVSIRFAGPDEVQVCFDELQAAVREGLVKAGAIVKPLRDWLPR